MAASQNGWVANDRSKVVSQLVPGTRTNLTVRKDAPGLLLLEVASAFDRLVEDIDDNYNRGALDDWGYAKRPIRGGAELSNHASGTGVDLNATDHPLGKVGTFTPAQTATIRKIVDVTRGVVRWGGDYGTPSRGGVKNGRVDEMHFEINDDMTMAQCEAALAAMRAFNRTDASVAPTAPAAGKYPTIKRGSEGDAVKLIQRFLGVVPTSDPGYGKFGPLTERAVERYQRMMGLAVDGVVGPRTWEKTRL